VLEDPEAASAVFSADWAPAVVDLVGWELTKSIGIFPEVLGRWLHGGNPRAAFLAAVSAHLVRQSEAFSPAAYARDGFFMCVRAPRRRTAGAISNAHALFSPLFFFRAAPTRWRPASPPRPRSSPTASCAACSLKPRARGGAGRPS